MDLYQTRMMDKAKKKAELDIFNTLGIQVDIKFEPLPFQGEGDCYYRFDACKDVPISTKEIGLFAVIIESLQVSVVVFFYDKIKLLAIDYKFRYSHVSGGTNGNTTNRRFRLDEV